MNPLSVKLRHRVMDSPALADSRAPSRAGFWLGIGLVCAAAIAGSALLKVHLRQKFHPGAALPVLARIGADLRATERSGRTVSTGSLKGKVWVVAQLYTLCPHGCLAVIGEMSKLNSEFGSRADFQLVSVTVAPERDDTALLRSFADGIGLKPGDPWWFLTGDRARLWSFMSDELKLEPARPIPEKERLNPLDLYAHDLRIVLVDRQGCVRGYYAVFHPEAQIAELIRGRLRADVRRLLDEPSGKPNPNPSQTNS